MFVLLVLSLLVITPWLDMSIAIRPVTVIANGMDPPIRMASFPSMETVQPEGFTEQPDIAGSQIVILVAQETDVFVTVPDVTVRNHYRGHFHRCRSHNHHWLRSHNHEWLKRHPSVRLNDTAGHKTPSRH